MVLILYYYIPRITKFDWSIKKKYDKQHQKKRKTGQTLFVT